MCPRLGRQSRKHRKHAKHFPICARPYPLEFAGERSQSVTGIPLRSDWVIA